jgi:hypothetical protein
VYEIVVVKNKNYLGDESTDGRTVLNRSLRKVCKDAEWIHLAQDRAHINIEFHKGGFF